MSLWAVDRTRGTVRWKRPLGGGNRRMMKQQMSSPSPVTDGRSVWVMTGTGVLKAFDFEGKELWTRNIQQEYGRFGLQWGYASSPLLHEDALYVQVLHGMHTDDPSYLLRIDKATGKTVWRVNRPTNARFESPDAYTTPALLRYGGATEIVITGGDVVTGHDPATGKEVWRADGLNPRNDGSYRVVASPVVHGDMIFAPSRERPLLALKPGGKGDVTSTHVLWSFNNGPDVPTPVSDGTYLYSINDRGIMYVPRGEDREDGLRAAASAQRDLQRVRRPGRREDLHHRRRRRDERRAGRARSSCCWPRTISATTRSAHRRCPRDRSS